MNEMTISFTTNGSGAATGYGDRAILGIIYALEYQPTSIATGATVTITVESGATTYPVLTKASAGTTNTIYYPRQLVNAVSDGAALVGTSGGDRVCPVVNGKPKVVIASGGDTKVGKVILYFEE